MTAATGRDSTVQGGWAEVGGVSAADATVVPGNRQRSASLACLQLAALSPPLAPCSLTAFPGARIHQVPSHDCVWAEAP